MNSFTTLEGSQRSTPEGICIADTALGTQVELTITLRGKEALPAEAIRPQTDSNSGRQSASTMTKEQIESRWGATAEDADLVEHVLGRYGIKTTSRSLGGRSLEVTGTVAQVQVAFGTKLAEYRSSEYGEFRGRKGDLQIPSELAGIITGVFGLDTRRVARHHASPASAPPIQGLLPTQLAQMYGFGGAKANGEIVGILEFGGAYVASDLQLFCRDIGVTPPSVDVIEVPKGAQGKASNGATAEVMMDVQIVAGMAQGAQINVYFAHFTQKGWVNLLNSIVHGSKPIPKVISISYGVAEDSGSFSLNGMKVIDGYFQEAAQMGVTICVSAGDDGCGSLEFDGKAHTNFPASSPNVLAVGGTMLNGGSEVTWWETPGRRFNQDGTSTGGGSTGGGVSTIFPRPSWQTVNTASINPGASTAGRCVPDVSALAGPPYYFLVLGGQPAPNGGTSASSPMWASVIACLIASGKNVGFLPPKLYADNGNGMTVGAAVCNDITSGDNHSSPPPKGYKAGPGYDAVTGWGTPNVTALLNNAKI